MWHLEKYTFLLSSQNSNFFDNVHFAGQSMDVHLSVNQCLILVKFTLSQ